MPKHLQANGAMLFSVALVVAGAPALAAEGKYTAGKFCHDFGSTGPRASGHRVALEPLLSSVKEPKTELQLLGNLKFAADNDVFFHPEFYSEENIKTLFGAKSIALDDRFGRCSYSIFTKRNLFTNRDVDIIHLEVTPYDRMALSSEFFVTVVMWDGISSSRGGLKFDPGTLASFFDGYGLRPLSGQAGVGNEIKDYKYSGQQSLAWAILEISRKTVWPSHAEFRFYFDGDGRNAFIGFRQTERF
ncbi:hypothetical protein SAMN05428974_1989 [Sphingopyxis sp. YR583]|jgi:hypothetical protein|uniref:hypothetical protein n=1 Tax=Sphingopyxis sp. YR583 TaxID=1881047 RepID=UPI0008A7F718|nr:hypothetical protein [Sphingopyxis sp. YR583]SEH16930.1 hypothetical protein SAMN05428974_1989 [Sphingopyxis sp. YR583]